MPPRKAPSSSGDALVGRPRPKVRSPPRSGPARFAPGAIDSQRPLRVWGVRFRREGVLGTLEVGKLADVLVVDGDPLEDLMALTNVRLVVREGTIIRAEDLDE